MLLTSFLRLSGTFCAFFYQNKEIHFRGEKPFFSYILHNLFCHSILLHVLYANIQNSLLAAAD